MKFTITGASGFVGTRLTRELVKLGHEVTVLTRNKSSAVEKLGIPVNVYEWDPLSEEAPFDSVKDADIVINLAGENISNKRWSDKQKEKIYNSRVIGTENLVRAIEKRETSLPVFITTSAIGIYPKNLESRLSEDSELDNGFLATVCKDWEQKAKAAKKVARLVIFRLGVVFGEESGALAKLLPIFKLGGGGPIGSGKAGMSWIHVDDLVKLLIDASENTQYEGPINAVAPKPVSNKEFTKALGDAVGMPAFFPVPPIMLKIVFGEMASIILDSQWVEAKKLADIGHNFLYPDIQSALNQICHKKEINGVEYLGLESFEAYQFIPNELNEVFTFFSNPENLNRITPAEIKFEMKKMSTEEIQKGTEIDYEFSKYGIPMKWKSLIADWKPQKFFTDIQLKGPYSVWHHTHAFYPVANGTIIHDKVLFKLPLGPLGFIVSKLLVRSDINGIFKYRQKVLSKVF